MGSSAINKEPCCTFCNNCAASQQRRCSCYNNCFSCQLLQHLAQQQVLLHQFKFVSLFFGCRKILLCVSFHVYSLYLVSSSCWWWWKLDATVSPYMSCLTTTITNHVRTIFCRLKLMPKIKIVILHTIAHLTH